MKKRFAKTVALVVAAALTAGAPVSVMAAEEQSETVAVQEGGDDREKVGFAVGHVKDFGSNGIDQRC